MNDADFLRWLKDRRKKRVVLAEIALGYESGGVMTAGAVYLSSGRYVTRPTDSVPNRRYHAAISRMSAFGSSLDPATLALAARVPVASIELDNPDGRLDWLLDVVIDGRAITFWVGDEEWPRGWFRQIVEGVVRRVRASGERIVLDVADRRLSLDVAVLGKPIASGPEAGRLKPLVYGVAYNLSLRCLSETDNEYQALHNYTASSYVREVRDAGISLGATTDAALFSGDNTAITANAGTDTIQFTGHGLAANDVVLISTTGTVFAGLTADTRYWVISAGLTSTDFRLSLTRGGSAVDISGTAFTGTMSVKRFRYMDNCAVDGTIQLSTTPVGQITADVWERLQGGYEPFSLAQALIEFWRPDLAAAIDADTFSAANVALRARYDGEYAFCGLAVEDRANLLEILAELLVPFGGWVGPDFDGRIRAGLVAPADIASESATRELSRGAILAEPEWENQPVAFGGATVGSRRNWTVQADGLAESLTEDERALYIRPDRLQASVGATFDAPSSSYAGSWWAHHDGAFLARAFRSLHGVESSLPVSVVGSEVARELVVDQAPWRRVARVQVGLEAYDWRLGEVVAFSYPRYGCDAGVNFRLIGKQIDLLAGEIALELLTQVTPDYTTSDYP